MAQQTINVGTAPNDGTGTPLRTAFQYTNSNFSELYTAVGPSGNNIVVPGSATISGDLTVRTNKLAVTSTGVGAGTASPLSVLTVQSQASARLSVRTTDAVFGTVVGGTAFDSLNGSDASLVPFGVRGSTVTLGSSAGIGFQIDASGNATWQNVGGVAGTAMTLNSTGLGVGASPSYKLHVAGSNPTAAINSTTASASSISTLLYRNADGNSNTYSVASIAGETAGNGGYGNLIFSTGFNGSLVERMRIDLSGNLGIGVTPSAWRSTQKALQIGAVGTYFSSAASGGSTCIGRNVYENSAGDFTYIVNDEATFYEQTATGTHAWYTAAAGTGTISFGSAKMTLSAAGNLLVGTTTDVSTVRMQVWSSSSDNTAQFRNSNATPYGPSIKYTAATPNNTGSEFLYCEDSTALRASIRSNGGIANYQANDVSLSDSRLKTDIKPLASYWNKIKSLELVTFKYKDQTHSDDNIGLIAQQVESVAPELVDVDGFGETPSDGVPIKTIYTTDLYHAAIKALQEAMARIEALEAKLA